MLLTYGQATTKITRQQTGRISKYTSGELPMHAMFVRSFIDNHLLCLLTVYVVMLADT
jgi:hypothetical protein